MRFFVLLILVLLLPFRGGMGEAMAAAGPHHSTTQQHQDQHRAGSAALVASVTHAHDQQVPEDCAGHSKAHGGTAAAHAAQPSDAGAAADGEKTADTKAANAACDACSACQTCHAVGLAFSMADMQPMPAPNALPAALSAEFASASAARDQKPPIS